MDRDDQAYDTALRGQPRLPGGQAEVSALGHQPEAGAHEHLACHLVPTGSDVYDGGALELSLKMRCVLPRPGSAPSTSQVDLPNGHAPERANRRSSARYLGQSGPLQMPWCRRLIRGGDAQDDFLAGGWPGDLEADRQAVITEAARH